MAQTVHETSDANKPQDEIVFSDVDGTLLTTDKRIAPNAAALIRRVSANTMASTARTPLPLEMVAMISICSLA